MKFPCYFKEKIDVGQFYHLQATSCHALYMAQI
jgi:hypothetical protein